MNYPLNFDQEIERTISRIRVARRNFEALQLEEMADPEHNAGNGEQQARPLREYAMPNCLGIGHPIAGPAIAPNNYELKPALIQMVQQNQFGGSGAADEDANAHLISFLEICGTIKINGVPPEVIQLRLFPFSLRDKAKIWLSSMPAGTFNSWAELSQAFLNKYFPATKTAKLRESITKFQQQYEESLYEAWERFKDLVRRCPHHGLPEWLVVQTFYQGISPQTRLSLDAAANGSLMNKTHQEAMDLIEDMALNNFQWGGNDTRVVRKQMGGVLEVDGLTAINAKLDALTKRLDKMHVNSVAPAHAPVAMCELCGDVGHTSQVCEVENPFSSNGAESVNFVGNQYNQQRGNPYSNTYNPGWRNHPNLSWGGNQN